MGIRTLETDYLVVGAGASGMAFADALVADCDADVVIVDRRHAPGGHWNDSYPFVRLHQPAAYYGVNSLPLGSETIDRHGMNEGFYAQASAPEIRAYYEQVMNERLLASGRVRYFPMCEYRERGRFASRLSGDEYEVKIRRKEVDGRYLEPSIPATYPPPFEVSPGARCVPPNDLVHLTEPADGYVVIGAGKTSADTCLWLLANGVPPDDIRWVKPREIAFLNRAYAQGGELVSALYDGFSLQLEAAAQASSIDDLFARLCAVGQLLRVDESVAPTMYTAATTSVAEVERLRCIRSVVRLGRVRRIDRDSIVLDEGSIPTSPRHVHVHCAAPGLTLAPGVPIFADDRITVQPVRAGLVPFNAALIGFVEATRRDSAIQNALCPPNPMPDVPLDWARGMLISSGAERGWAREPDVADWLERARLNISRGLKGKSDDPQVQQARRRLKANVVPALQNLMQIVARGTG
ncbi:MAG TPA: NAD(P)-binding protein [Polyangiaceae bacterium]|nr:NAD(P)-binding protein [Polyangiaceae bacterium]